MILTIVGVVLVFIIVFIFLNFYNWSGLRVRRYMSKIPGYSEAESWVLSFEAASMPSEGIKDFLLKIFNHYPSICSVWFLGYPNCYLSSPGNIEVLLKSVEHITKGREYFVFEQWLGEGLLTSTGAKWHANRKMLTPAFHFRILETCVPIFNRNTELLIQLVRSQWKSEEAVNIEKFISLCSLDIMSEAAMGVRIDAQLQKNSTLEYVNAVRRMGELSLNRVKTYYLRRDWIYNLTSWGREQKKLLNILHGFTENVIKESKEKRRRGKISGASGEINTLIGTNGESIIHQSKNYDQRPSAFVDFLLEMAENEPGVFTDVEIRQEVDTFMFEGHETTSSSIAWSLLLLGSSPDIQDKAYDEILGIFGESGRQATRQDLTKMIYLEAVIKESLRLYPPVSYISRCLSSDLELENHTVPAQTNVIVIPYFLHRRGDLFPEPEKFNPDRFLNSENLNRHPFMYIPFSGGPRNCIGQRFAMMEMKVVLSYFLRNFKIESVTKREGLKILFSPILRPLNGTYVKLSPRI